MPYCPKCKGSGMMPLEHAPGSKGGWLDKDYYALSDDDHCPICHGSGYVPESTYSVESEMPPGTDRLEWKRKELLKGLSQSGLPQPLKDIWHEELFNLDFNNKETGDRLNNLYKNAKAYYENQGGNISSLVTGLLLLDSWYFLDKKK